MKCEEAEEFTQALGQIVGGSWRQIAWAQRFGIPKALGLTTEQWVKDRLGGYVRMSVEGRREAVKNLTAEGYSARQIADIVGVSHETAASDVRNLTADPIDAIAAMAADNKLKMQIEREEKAAQRRAVNAKLKLVKPEPTAGQFGTIIIDPPWDMQKIERDVRPNQTAFDYPTMTREELEKFPVGFMAAPDCHLFCWATQKHLPDAILLVEVWGFTYVFLMTWHKPGGFQPHGLPQYNSEFVVYARRGTPKFRDTQAFSTSFQGERREHSRKPDVFYDTIRRVTHEGRIDIFSREKREGFAQYGNETGKFSYDKASSGS